MICTIWIFLGQVKMNTTVICFGFEKNIYNYLPVHIYPEEKRSFPKKSFKRFWRRQKRRYFKHIVKRYAYAKKELLLFGKVRGRVVYDTICAPNPKKKGYVMRWSEPSYRVDERGKRIEIF